jgi:hypothetical protein
MPKFDYNFKESWGYTNCDLCDADVLCNEYLRSDGLVQWICKKCADGLHI